MRVYTSSFDLFLHFGFLHLAVYAHFVSFRLVLMYAYCAEMGECFFLLCV
jgi:hypothetical protein